MVTFSSPPASAFSPILTPPSPGISLPFDVPENRSFQILTSFDLLDWFPWDIPGNGGLPSAGGTHVLTGPATGDHQFFRVRLWQN